MPEVPKPKRSRTPEHARLEESRERAAHWKRWGPYLSERAWGTVREDYSATGDAWEFLTHDLARSKAYRWNEDGIAGICDRHQFICFAVSMWNGRDPFLKERLFGLTGPQGNHGEDVKECYYYLESTPTHSWMRFLYKYPHSEFPYRLLAEENGRRDRHSLEFELTETGIFDQNRYFDIFVEYAKGAPEDILIRVTAANRGPERAVLHLLPTLWFRNMWSWGHVVQKPYAKPGAPGVIEIQEPYYGQRWLNFEGDPELLFAENDTNFERLYGCPNASPHAKDSFDDYVVHGRREAVNPERIGSKVAAYYRLSIAPGESASIRLRLSDKGPGIGQDFEEIWQQRRDEAASFLNCIALDELTEDGLNVMRQAVGGLLMSKQFYHYVVRDWLDGDPGFEPPPGERKNGRNREWGHLFNSDVISMPDKWEYPWYAAWDLAFHCVPLALVDADFAKEQLTLIVREWYMHPNGQLPAYEWALGDVNPPVHAWAAFRVYKIEQKRRGAGDREFLERIFHKLMLNFTWWVNRKDAEGRNIFQGGFLGLDNIGVFDRSSPLPTGGYIEQADGTGWMAMYCLDLLAIAMELARDNPSYEDVASKFWEHFLYIANAINHVGQPHDGIALWDDQDGFFYDVLRLPSGYHLPLRIRSMVGLIPLFAVQMLDGRSVARAAGFKRRMDWFLDNRHDLTNNIPHMNDPRQGERRLLSLVNADQLTRILKVMLDEREFLSPYGIRALSKVHEHNPFVLHVDGVEYRVEYEPAESRTPLFGGNSNWRGPVWFPVNYLLIESLQKFHHYYGDEFKVECPTGSGQFMTLWEVAAEI
jgi:hypothetical protein